MSCSDCGETSRFIDDFHEGNLVCGNCGLVRTQNLPDSLPLYDGQEEDDLLSIMIEAAINEPKVEKRRRPVPLPEILGSLPLSPEQHTRCRRLLEDMKKHHPMRITEVLQATALYILRLEYSLPWHDEAIAAWTGVAVVQFQRMYKKYASLMHNKRNQVAWNRQIITLMPTLISDAQTLGFPPSSLDTIQTLVTKMRPHVGSRQNVLHSLVFYYLRALSTKPITIKALTQFMGILPTTLEKNALKYQVFFIERGIISDYIITPKN